MIPKSGDRFSDKIMLQQKRQGVVAVQRIAAVLRIED